jgi:hypothetical protein
MPIGLRMLIAARTIKAAQRKDPTPLRNADTRRRSERIPLRSSALTQPPAAAVIRLRIPRRRRATRLQAAVVPPVAAAQAPTVAAAATRTVADHTATKIRDESRSQKEPLLLSGSFYFHELSLANLGRNL